MLDFWESIAELVKEDRRYSSEAYGFVYQALGYAQSVLDMGTETPSEPIGAPDQQSPDQQSPDQQSDEEQTTERHVSGQELCEAIRQFAIEQYGYMAKTVLNSWGVKSTGDFGEIVFSLIRIGRMRKTPHDHREDFADLYDFDVAFQQEFKITPPE